MKIGFGGLYPFSGRAEKSSVARSESRSGEKQLSREMTGDNFID